MLRHYNILEPRSPSSTDKGHSPADPGGAPGCRGRPAAAVYGSTCKEADGTEWGGASVSRNTRLFLMVFSSFYGRIKKAKNRGKKKVEMMHSVLVFALGLTMCMGMKTSTCEDLILRASYVQRRAFMSS
jgi:hypothetical protein